MIHPPTTAYMSPLRAATVRTKKMEFRSGPPASATMFVPDCLQLGHSPGGSLVLTAGGPVIESFWRSMLLQAVPSARGSSELGRYGNSGRSQCFRMAAHGEGNRADVRRCQRIRFAVCRWQQNGNRHAVLRRLTTMKCQQCEKPATFHITELTGGNRRKCICARIMPGSI